MNGEYVQDDYKAASKLFGWRQYCMNFIVSI